MTQQQALRYFPVALFSGVMGFSALTVVAKNMEHLWNINHMISTVLLIMSVIFFVLNGVIFLYRYVYFRQDVHLDFNHPIKMNFFPTISISLLLLSVSFIDISSRLSFAIWLVGALLQLILTLVIMTKLIWRDGLQMGQFTTVSFIPIVGNAVVPIAGSYHVIADVNWFFYSVGMILSLVFLTIFINRLFFHPALPEKMLPTLFILLAPPSVGFVAYLNLTGELNVFSYSLYGFAFFTILLLLLQLKHILKVPFGIPWWSILFPSSAFTIATIQMHLLTGYPFYLWITYALVIGLVLLVIYLTWKTIQSWLRGTLSIKDA